MPKITEQELKLQIRNKDFARLYLICGQEAFLKRSYCEKIVSKCVDKDFADFNLHRFDGKNLSTDEISEAVEAFPMMSDRTCTVITDPALDSLTQTQFENLIEILEDPPETTVILIIMENIEFSANKNERCKIFNKTVDEVGYIVSFDKMTPAELAKVIANGATKRGSILSRSNAEYLISHCGNDMNTLQNELDKLCFYVGEGEITKAVINEIASKSFEASAFDMVKAITAKSADKAFEIFYDLNMQGIKPEMILGAIISNFTDMYRAKVCTLAGENVEYAANIFPAYKGKEFKLRKANQNNRGLTIERLRMCLDELDACDESLKTYAQDPKITIEKLIIKLILLLS